MKKPVEIKNNSVELNVLKDSKFQILMVFKLMHVDYGPGCD